MPFLDEVYSPGEKLPDNWGICLYGFNNMRKTSSLRTMPGHGFVLDYPTQEGGTNVLAGYGPRIQVRPIRAWEEIDEAFWYFMQDNPKLPKRSEVAKKGEVWADDDPRWLQVRAEWVAHDTCTASQDVAKRSIINSRAPGIPLPSAAAAFDLHWKEYNPWYATLSESIYKFKTIPGLVCLWLAQERVESPNEERPEGWIGPNMRDRVLEALNPSMMLIARYFIAKASDGTLDYRVRILPTMEGQTRIVAKTRHPVSLYVPEVIRNINLGQLLAYTLKGQGEPPEEVKIDPVPTQIEFVS